MHSSTIDEIASLGNELNANQYRIVCLAAQFDTGMEWFRHGHPNPATAIARVLDIHTSTAREWIRVGHALDYLPGMREAFANNDLSYAKARILTRWANPDNELELLALAHDRTANRLTTAIANHIAGDETKAERNNRRHGSRSVTIHTDADGMIIIRGVLPRSIGKPLAETLNTIIKQVVATPLAPADPSADASPPHSVTGPATPGSQHASADASAGPTMAEQLRHLKQAWQPADDDGFIVPTLSQQRADAFVPLFLGHNIELVTEIIIHVRDDGTPSTTAHPSPTTQSFSVSITHSYA